MAKQLRTAKSTSCDLEIWACENYCDSLCTKNMSHASGAAAGMKENSVPRQSNIIYKAAPQPDGE